MHKGVSLQGTYTYSHSIDDASRLAAAAAAPSRRTTWTSAPRRATPASTVVIPSTATSSSSRPSAPTAPSSTRAASGRRSSTATPSPATTPSPPAATHRRQYTGTPAEIAVGAQLPAAQPGALASRSRARERASPVVQSNAFAALCDRRQRRHPIAEAGAYGTASRNSIEMPGTVSVSGSLSRTISFGGTRSFEARINASNALNTVQYAGVSTTAQFEFEHLWSGHRSRRAEAIVHYTRRTSGSKTQLWIVSSVTLV